MKYAKTLAFAAIAAAALVALVGASSASATVLCKTQGQGTPTGTTCPANWAMRAGDEVHAVIEGVSKTTTIFKNIECQESTFKGKLENEGSNVETVLIKIEEWTFGKCNCDVEILKAGFLELHWIQGTHHGTITSDGLEETVECESIFGVVHCIYSTNDTDLGKLTGSATTSATATADIQENAIPVAPTNGLCDEGATWDAKYKITTPDALNVSDHT